MEQILIDLSYFLVHDAFQWFLYFLMLSLYLTPKYGRAPAVLIPFAIGMIKPIHYILASKDWGLILCVLIYCGTALLFYQEKKRVCIFAAVLGILNLCLCGFSVSATAIAMLGYIPTETEPHNWESIIYSLIISVFLFIFFAVVLLIWNKALKRNSSKSMGLFLLFPLSQGLFFNACMYCILLINDKAFLNNPYLYIATAVSVVCDVVLFVALRQNSRVHEMKQRMELLEHDMELQLKYYDRLTEQYKVIREYRHDIRNMISAVKMLDSANSSAARDELISEMDKKADKMSIPIYSADPLVNAVLWQKSCEADKAGLGFETDVSADNIGIENIDLCSLLVNLLDNAIAEAKISENGVVKLEISRRAGILFICCENSSEKSISSFESRPKSSKRGDHGHGNEILDRIAEKYDGKYSLSADGKTACAVVSLVETDFKATQ